MTMENGMSWFMYTVIEPNKVLTGGIVCQSGIEKTYGCLPAYDTDKVLVPNRK
jgi:hypothetical protein